MKINLVNIQEVRLIKKTYYVKQCLHFGARAKSSHFQSLYGDSLLVLCLPADEIETNDLLLSRVEVETDRVSQ